MVLIGSRVLPTNVNLGPTAYLYVRPNIGSLFHCAQFPFLGIVMINNICVMKLDHLKVVVTNSSSIQILNLECSGRDRDLIQ